MNNYFKLLVIGLKRAPPLIKYYKKLIIVIKKGDINYEKFKNFFNNYSFLTGE